MVIILNGSIGVGKTSTSWALNSKISKSVMIDGDYFGAVNPFNLQDPSRLSYLYSVIAQMITFHKSNGYEHFIINYVFESKEELNELIDKINIKKEQIFPFFLVCSPAEQAKRIRKRANSNLDWELSRALELNQILELANVEGKLGQLIDTNDKDVGIVAEGILAETSY